MAVMSGALGSSENSALQGRLASSFHRTVTDAVLEATVTGPRLTPDPSNGTDAVNRPAQNSKTVRLFISEPRLTDSDKMPEWLAHSSLLSETLQSHGRRIACPTLARF